MINGSGNLATLNAIKSRNLSYDPLAAENV